MTHIFLVAAEDSGDAIGADVIDALRAADPSVVVSGIGGERMRARGASFDVDMSGLAVLGLVEGLIAFGRVKQAVEDAADVIAKADPDSVVLIDSWGFMWRLARTLDLRGVRAKRIKLIGPQVWRPARVVRAYSPSGSITYCASTRLSSPFTSSGAYQRPSSATPPCIDCQRATALASASDTVFQ